MTRATFVRPYDGRSYQMTAEDVEWLARSLGGETGDADLVESWVLHSWCMMNRYLLWKSNPWGSFTKFLRRFSQPINPAWVTPTEEMCAKFLKQHGFNGCTPALIARRKKIQAQPYENLSDELRQFVEDFSVGGYPYPAEYPIYVDFRIKHKGESTGVLYGERFFTKDEIGPYFVEGGVDVVAEQPVHPDFPGPVVSDKPASVGWAVAALFAGAAGAYLLFRHVREFFKR